MEKKGDYNPPERTLQPVGWEVPSFQSNWVENTAKQTIDRQEKQLQGLGCWNGCISILLAWE